MKNARDSIFSRTFKCYLTVERSESGCIDMNRIKMWLRIFFALLLSVLVVATVVIYGKTGRIWDKTLVVLVGIAINWIVLEYCLRDRDEENDLSAKNSHLQAF